MTFNKTTTSMAARLQGQAHVTAYNALVAEMVRGGVPVEAANARLQNRVAITENVDSNGSTQTTYIFDNNKRLLSMRAVGRIYFPTMYDVAPPAAVAVDDPMASSTDPFNALLTSTRAFTSNFKEKMANLLADDNRTKHMLERSEQECKRLKAELTELKSLDIRCTCCDDEFKIEERTVLPCGHWKTCKKCLQSAFDNAPKPSCSECDAPFNIDRL